MGAGEVSGEDPPLRVEAVREGPHTRVTRLSFPDRTTIRKQPLGPDADRLLRHELAVLERVRGVGVWRSWWTAHGIRTRSCWPTPGAPAWPN
jgi:hypothetical protein